MDSFTNVSVNSSGTAVPPPLGFNAIKDEEEALARRHRRKNLFQQDLVFEFTRDPGLLHQYYRIRKDSFDSVLGVDYGNGETEYDRKGHVLVIRMGNFCVGGARIIVKSPRKNELLPMEINGFRLEEQFPQLRHQQLTYCQTGVIALLPEFRGGDITTEMFRRLHSKCVALNVDISFAIAPKLNARLERQICSSLGLETKIHYEVDLPSYPYLENVKHYLISIIVNKPRVKSFPAIVAADKHDIVHQPEDVVY